MVKTYLVLGNSKILKVYESTSKSGVDKSISADGVILYDEIRELEKVEFNGLIGQDIGEFDEKWNLKPLSQRVADGYVVLSKFEKVENENIVPKGIQELYDEGVIEVDKWLMYKDGELVVKNLDDYKDSGEDDAVEYAKKEAYRRAQQEFDEIMSSNSFISSIAIEVDCRRSGVKNDIQNVESLISVMEASGTTKVLYRGVSETKEITIDQMKVLLLEMRSNGLTLYKNKWEKEELIKNCTTIKQLKDVFK